MPHFMLFLLCFFLILSFFILTPSGLNIDDFNAVADKDSKDAAFHNVQAFTDALEKANSSSTDRVVTVPYGKNYFFGMMVFHNVHDVLLDIQGTVTFSDDIKRVWDAQDNLRNGSMIEFQDSFDITISGGGTFDGQGLKWWRLAYTGLCDE